MKTVAPPVERALLVGAPRKGSPDARDVEEHLDELARLVDTAGAEVAGRIVQHIEAPTPDLYIGSGKAAEIGRRVVELGAGVVIFDEELSPRQGKHLEEALSVRVMDRTELILDIFALRARSRRGQDAGRAGAARVPAAAAHADVGAPLEDPGRHRAPRARARRSSRPTGG